MCQKYEYYILDDDSTILRVPIDSEGKKNIYLLAGHGKHHQLMKKLQNV
ncbi:MAG: hypothetical protein ACOX5Y_00605 [Acholeplasmataceae bacterium]|jgi:hypothetical protein